MKPFIRRMIEFRRFNLMETFHPPRPFDVIFCRNVMIYFDKDTQEQLVNRLACCLEPGGYLVTGHSESLTGLKHPFQYVSPSVYRSAEETGRDSRLCSRRPEHLPSRDRKGAPPGIGGTGRLLTSLTPSIFERPL